MIIGFIEEDAFLEELCVHMCTSGTTHLLSHGLISKTPQTSGWKLRYPLPLGGKSTVCEIPTLVLAKCQALGRST